MHIHVVPFIAKKHAVRYQWCRHVNIELGVELPRYFVHFPSRVIDNGSAYNCLKKVCCYLSPFEQFPNDPIQRSLSHTSRQVSDCLEQLIIAASGDWRLNHMSGATATSGQPMTVPKRATEHGVYDDNASKFLGINMQ